MGKESKMEEISQADRERIRGYLKESNIVLLNRARLKYFGILLYGLKKYIYYKKEAIGAGDLSEHLINDSILAYTNGNKVVILCDPDNSINSKEEVIFVLLHELLHIILGHVHRCGNRNPEIWNIAADHVVNCMIMDILTEKEKELANFERSVYFTDLKEKYPNAKVETIYDILINNCNKRTGENGTSFTYKNGKSDKCEIEVCEISSKHGDGDGNSNSGGYYKITNKTGEKYGSLDTQGKLPGDLDPKDCVNPEDGDCSEGANDCEITSSDNLRETIDNHCETLEHKAKVLWNSSANTSSRGMTPANVSVILDDIYSVEVPWESIAESAILYNVQAAKRRSWSVKNIYIRNVRVPGKYKGMEKGTFLGVIDTSGSISDDELKKFSGLVVSTLTHFKGLHLLYHDYTVCDEVYYKNVPSEMELYNRLKRVKGRGGTSHEDAFNKISKIVEDENVSIIAFMTDFYSDVASIYKKYDWVREYPMIWFIVNNTSVTDEYLNNLMTESTVTAVNINTELTINRR